MNFEIGTADMPHMERPADTTLGIEGDDRAAILILDKNTATIPLQPEQNSEGNPESIEPTPTPIEFQQVLNIMPKFCGIQNYNTTPSALIMSVLARNDLYNLDGTKIDSMQIFAKGEANSIVIEVTFGEDGYTITHHGIDISEDNIAHYTQTNWDTLFEEDGDTLYGVTLTCSTTDISEIEEERREALEYLRSDEQNGQLAALSSIAEMSWKQEGVEEPAKELDEKKIEAIQASLETGIPVTHSVTLRIDDKIVSDQVEVKLQSNIGNNSVTISTTSAVSGQGSNGVIEKEASLSVAIQ